MNAENFFLHIITWFDIQHYLELPIFLAFFHHASLHRQLYTPLECYPIVASSTIIQTDKQLNTEPVSS